MRVGIEIRNLRIGVSGGIVPLVAGVLDALTAAHGQHEFVVFRTIFGRGIVAEDRTNVRVVLLPLSDDWAPLQQALERERVDVLFRAYPTLDQLTFPPGRQVVLIPDLQHEHHPEFFSATALRWRKLAFGRALRGAGAIAAISEFVRGAILAQPGAARADVFVMPPALRADVRDDATAPTPELARRIETLRPYFYYPANLWPHKNHRRIIAAFDCFRRETGSAAAFVFTGHSAGWDRLVGEFPELPLHHLGFVGGGDQRTIYRSALALAFFSLHEGFGMPLLEAFAADCPVICSNTTSLPEVGGDAVLSGDPTDVAAITRLMATIAESAELRRSLVLAGHRRLSRHSWQSSAAELMAAVERVAQRAAASADNDRASSLEDPARLRRSVENLLSRTRRAARRLRRAFAGKQVTGLWPDYWIAPDATFDTPTIARCSTLFLAGHAPCDGSLSVLGQDRVLATVPLRADVRVSVKFASPGTGPVQLCFSSSILDSRNRRLAFQVDSTNLFDDIDVL